MTFYPKDPLFIGVDPLSKRMAILKKKGKGFVFPELLEASIEEIVKKIPKEESAAISIPTKDVLIKNLSFPLKGEREIQTAIDFQLEPLLPYPIEKCKIGYVKVQEKEQSLLLTCFSTKKETVSKYQNLYGIETDFISTPALALAALAEELEEHSSSYFFVYVGKEEGTLAVFENGKILTARYFEKEKREIEKTFLALNALYKNKKIETLYLISEEEGFDKIFAESGLKVKTPSFPNLPLTEEHLKKYALCIGLALAKAKNFPNFSEKKSLAQSWKKSKSSILAALLLLLTLFTTLFILGEKQVSKKEAELFARYQKFIKEERPASLSEMETNLSQFQKKLEGEPDLYPLVPLVPKISDFIAWLTGEFPNVFQIEEFRYQLAKRPELNNKEEIYLVVVDMTMNIENPSVAEAIRTLLTTSNSFVDIKKEFTWEIDKGKYHTTFYLKDKTRYN